MAEIAKEKFPQENVTILCGDVEETEFGRLFDCVVVYNAFPHFPEPERLVARLASLLKPGGTLTVAHGMSREKIDAHHRGTACRVSNGLMSAEELSAMIRYSAGYLRPLAIRYPRGTVWRYDRDPAPIEYGKAEVLKEGEQVTILAFGSAVREGVLAEESSVLLQSFFRQLRKRDAERKGSRKAETLT